MSLEAKKFIFEKTFDVELESKILEEELEPLEPPRLYTEAQYETAVTDAKADAIKIAKQEIIHAVETKTDEALTAFLSQIESLCETCHQSYEKHFQYNTELTVAILTKIFPVLFKDHNLDELSKILEENMLSLKKSNEIRIHIPEDTPETLKTKLLEQFKIQNKEDILSFIEEPDYSEHQISIHWDNSGIERNSETILENIINTYRSKS